MQTKLTKAFLLLVFALFAISSWALVSDYTFANVAGAYTEISGGTVLLSGPPTPTNPVYNNIAIGFDFVYDGITYNAVSISENGFLAMGAEVIHTLLPISSATSSNHVIAAMSRDIQPRDNGELMYLSSGSAPNRVFTVQWKNFRRSPTATANDVLNFQIQLCESGNVVKFVYGNTTAVTATTAATVQVGLRGASNAEYNNRSTTTNWAETVAGSANNASCTLSATVFPASGLTFSFTPVQQGNPPSAAQNPIPANNATNVNPSITLAWSSSGGAPTGYKVYLGTNNPPTNLVNGASQTGTSYHPATALSYNTQYYWKIVPFNADGDAENCPVWSFTTWADPTITSYPYTQNFDTLTPPALPSGWSTINANNDTYTWESFADATANTAPNVMRIRYNTTMAMNDWLITPPLQLEGEYSYRISFYYRANSATYPEKLALYKGNAPTVAAMTDQIWINSNITNTTYQRAEILIPALVDGNIYLGFHGHSEADQFYLYVDSFKVEEITESLDPPTNLAATVNGTNVHLTWNAPGGGNPPDPQGFTDGFESYQDFALTFDPWVLVDVDQSGTYGISGYTWANAYAAMAYMIFNPTTTSPALATLQAHSGNKMAASFASTTPPNNDWMISPLVNVQAGQSLTFWARSYTEQYGLERFKVGVSTGGTAPANFTIISGANYIQAPVAWTQYSYDLSAYAGQSIRFGIQCVSNDAFFFMVDDVSVGSAPAKFAFNPVNDYPAVNYSRTTGTPVPDSRVLTRDLLGYKVYRNGILLNTITGATTTSYDDNGLDIGTYNYTVTAFYNSGESVPAGPVSATIVNTPAPLDLAATVAGNDVTLTWTSPETPATGNWITWCNTDALGNSIGTNSAAQFDVAHMFDATDLASYQGRSISQIKFVPGYQNCVYTVKVWTGGTATTPGTMVYSAVHDGATVGEWNLHILNTPVPIPADRLWIGYNVNTQGGHPAGCDDGPVVQGKGNIINFNNQWTTLTALASTLTYNWSIQGFAATGAAKNQILRPIVEAPNTIQNGTLEAARFEPNRYSRALTGFKVYRNGAQIAQINDPAITTYTDMDLPNGQYVYGVTALYTNGESVPATVNVTVDLQLAPAFFEDGFESYPDFALTFAPWTLLDQDNSQTYGFSGISFPNSASPMAYIVFNPTTTTPPITSLNAHGGNKMAASFAATTPPNNDWMITPRVTLGTNSSVRFYARSHTTDYGMERFRVGVSTLASIIPQGFQYISGPNYIETPANWTEYIYDLSAYDNQSIYLAIRCVSNDAFVFYVDDFSLHSVGGSVSNEDNNIPAIVTELKGNYPNPFNPETTIRYSVRENTPVSIDIYNVKGQLVKTLVNEQKAAGDYTAIWNGTDNNNRPVSSGVFFYKMNAGKYSSTKKMIMMK